MKTKTTFLLLFALMLAACNEEHIKASIDTPSSYLFERNGQSTVSFSGQTARIQMGEELISAMKDFSITAEAMLEMFRNETASGGDANPYSSSDLNASTKSIKSKTAASRDFFSANTADASIIKAEFEDWINKQVSKVFPNQNTLAVAGTGGQIADGSATRYVNAQGLEFDQLVNKGLIGALMLDQALNNYLGTAVLDEASNRADNDEGILSVGNNYTTMEHKWDEAYGYLYGTSANPTDPNPTIGADDSFLNKYIGRVDADEDYAGIATEIFEAFKLGRAAIVAKNYDVRDEQAAIIREKLSQVIAVRAVYYLQQGKNAITDGAMGTAFHDLSEGYGFIYSLQFTRQPNTNQPYFTKSEVDTFLSDLLGDGANGFWDVKAETLEAIAQEIATKFGLSVEQAGS